MSPSFTAGGECDAWCTKCKRDSLHNIIAVDPATRLPARVECRSCHGAHRYSAPKNGPKPAIGSAARTVSSTPKKAATPKASAPAAASRVIEQRWDDLMVKMAGVAEQPYSVKAAFEPGDAIRHTQFGLGFVTEKAAGNRIKVLFRDAERTLVSGAGI
jgi:hypothetical protein